MNVQAPAPYYRIRLDPVGTAIQAKCNRKEQFRYRFTGKDPRVIEINYIQEGNLCEMRDSGEHTYHQGTVCTLVNNREFTRYSTAPVLHEFYLAYHLAVPAVPISEEDVAVWTSDGSEAILPECITDPAICEQIGRLIKSALSLTARADPLRGLKLRSCLYECLTLVTEYAVKQAVKHIGAEAPQTRRYTQKACDYVRKHISEKISVDSVARAAGISYNHLKNIFQQDMKQSLVEYINQMKIHTVEQLITVDGMTLEEAGQLVGITDPSYLSRLFRRCTGMSSREYRRVYSERLEYSNA